MADKDLGKRTFESLEKASLSVRYSSLINVNRQTSSKASTVTAISGPSDSSSMNIGSSKPKLRTVVEACPPARMKVLLGLHQGNIRMLQSPAWLLEEQRRLSGKNRHDLGGERLVAAGNSLLDLCRFVEILLKKISQETSPTDTDKIAQKLGEKLAAIWSDLYLAVEHLQADCKRSAALVRHAGVELLNLGVELEDGHSYPDIWAQKFVSRLEVLSAGIADAYDLLPRILPRTKERSKSIKNVLSPNASIAKRSKGERRIGMFNEPSDTNAGLAREIKVICEAVNELVQKLGDSDPDSSETIGMLKLCAARLKGILSLSYSLKRWELELHRAHYFFTQAARRLSMAQQAASQDKTSPPGNVRYDIMAAYICNRFEDTMDHVLKKADSGYARHNFIRKQSGPIPSQRVLRSPANTPVLKNATVGHGFAKSGLTSPKKPQGTDLTRQTIGTPVSVAALISPLSNAVVSVERADPGTRPQIGTDKPINKQADVNTEPGSIRGKRLTRNHAPAPRRSSARAATMSVHWEELEALSTQQRSDKKTV